MPHKFSPTPLFRNVIVTDGGTVQINSAGNDKNIQIYHDDTNTIFKTSSGALYLQPGNNTIYGYDGTSTYAFALYTGAALGVMLHGGGNCYINNSNNFGVGLTDPDELVEFYKVGTQLKLSGGAADYATFAVAADGALTIATVDSAAANGHIILMPDGGFGVGTAPDEYVHFRKDQNADTTLHIQNDTAGTLARSRLLLEANSAAGQLFVADDGYTSETAHADKLVLYANSTAAALALISNGQGIEFYAGGDAAANLSMNISSAGEVTKPLQPAFLAVPSVDVNDLPINAYTTLTFDSEIFDQGGDFTGNTFTAPVDGRYLLSAVINLEDVDTAANYHGITIKTSNRTYYAYASGTDWTADSGYVTLSIIVVADMDALDTAYVQYVQSGGTAQSDLKTYSYFSGALIC